MSTHTTAHGPMHNLDNVNTNLSQGAQHTPTRSIDVLNYGMPENSQLSAERPNHSENIAERNISSSARLNQNESSSGSTAHNLRRMHGHDHLNEADGLDTRDNQHVEDPMSSSGLNNKDELNIVSTKRKPVPSNSDSAHYQESQSNAHHHPINEQTKSSLASAGIDLSNSTDTSHHTHMAPAATHETIQPVVHNIQTERITREVHKTDVYHRILPIKQVEHLPARHFIRSPSGGLIEMPLEDIPRALGLE